MAIPPNEWKTCAQGNLDFLPLFLNIKATRGRDAPFGSAFVHFFGSLHQTDPTGTVKFNYLPEVSSFKLPVSHLAHFFDNATEKEIADLYFIHIDSTALNLNNTLVIPFQLSFVNISCAFSVFLMYYFRNRWTITYLRLTKRGIRRKLTFSTFTLGCSSGPDREEKARSQKLKCLQVNPS